MRQNTRRKEHDPAINTQDLLNLNVRYQVPDAFDIVRAVGLPLHLNGDGLPDDYGDIPDEDQPYAELAFRLCTYAFDWGLATRRQTSADPAMVKKKATSINRLCASLRDELANDEGVLWDSISVELILTAQLDMEVTGSKEEIFRTIQSIERLGRWAGRMARASYRSDSRTEPRGRSDFAFKKLIGRLVGLYVEAFQRKPGLSADKATGVPTGPLFRFVQETIARLPIVKTDNAIRDNIRGHSAFSAWKDFYDEDWLVE